jgi:hypothetical protein
MGTIHDAPTSVANQGGMDRRTLIKRAAAAGAVGWTAPMVLGSIASPAAAGTPPQLGPHCFRYHYNWRWAKIVHDCADQGSKEKGQTPIPPAPLCDQSFVEPFSNGPNDPNENTAKNQHITSNGCCRETVNFDDTSDATMAATCQSGNVREWYQLPDIPGGCVSVTATADCATHGTGDLSVTFAMNTADCPNCWMHDFTVLFTDQANVLAANPTSCPSGDKVGTSVANAGGSATYKQVTFTFKGNNAPVWFKFLVQCDLTRQADSPFSGCSDNVPNTQNACLTSSPSNGIPSVPTHQSATFPVGGS